MEFSMQCNRTKDLFVGKSYSKWGTLCNFYPNTTTKEKKRVTASKKYNWLCNLDGKHAARVHLRIGTIHLFKKMLEV